MTDTSTTTPTTTPTRPDAAPPTTGRRPGGGIGDSPVRADGNLKVTGEFAYSSDLFMDGMVWGVTLRSPHPHARIVSIDIGPALATPGVHAVLTAGDVPGLNAVGLEHLDQPVLAVDVVRYQGEPVALVAADHPEVARRAAARVVVTYEPLEAVTDARRALDPTAPQLHESGNIVRHLKIRKGDPDPVAPVVVSLDFEVGMQDQAFLGPESGLAVPAEDGGVDLYVATQWLHVDQRQICSALALPPDKVRLTLAGVGGAFGGREDLSMHVHACLLALHTGKPVKMSYNREESFFGHVHRHPATMHYTHGFTRDGDLVFVRAQIWLDGGAYLSSSAAVVGNAGLMGIGPYVVPNVRMDCYGAYTNNPPCGAMRGFGAVQAAFGYESQMDRLAEAVGIDPAEIRIRNGLTEGDRVATGQVLDSAAPVAELVRRVREMPLPPPATSDLRSLPGGVANTTHGEGVRRGVGYGVGIKNICFSEGFDDYSTARVTVQVVGDEPLVTVHTAAVEVGQGIVTLQEQIARTELGIGQVRVETADTRVGSAGSTSASRQSYVTGGAVQAACREVAAELLSRASVTAGVAPATLSLEDGHVVGPAGEPVAAVIDLVGEDAVERTIEWRHRPTTTLDPET